jgi:hypothetical protein
MRRFFRGGRDITRDEAVSIARQECVARGFPWLEPVKVHWGYSNWTIWTHAGHRPAYLRIVIDRRTGHVKAVFGPMPR